MFRMTTTADPEWVYRESCTTGQYTWEFVSTPPQITVGTPCPHCGQLINEFTEVPYNEDENNSLLE